MCLSQCTTQNSIFYFLLLLHSTQLLMFHSCVHFHIQLMDSNQTSHKHSSGPKIVSWPPVILALVCLFQFYRCLLKYQFWFSSYHEKCLKHALVLNCLRQYMCTVIHPTSHGWAENRSYWNMLQVFFWDQSFVFTRTQGHMSVLKVTVVILLL